MIYNLEIITNETTLKKTWLNPPVPYRKPPSNGLNKCAQKKMGFCDQPSVTTAQVQRPLAAVSGN